MPPLSSSVLPSHSSPRRCFASSSTSAFTPFGAAWAAFGYSFPRAQPPIPEVKHLALGCILCLTSCVVTAIANSLMKLDALRIEAKVQQMILMDMDPWEPPPVYRRKIVGLAVVFYILSAVFDFWSLVYISMSIRACSSGLTVPANAAVARVMLGEGLSRAQTIGSILIVIGAVAAMAFGSSDDGGSDQNITALLSSARFITFVGITFPFYLLSFSVSRWSMRAHVAIDDHIPVSQAQVQKRRGRRAVALLALAFLGGYQSAVTALAGKFGAQYIAMDGLSAYQPYLCFSVVIASSLMQLTFMSWMMRQFDAVVCIPPYQILLMLFMVSFGAACFREILDLITG
ncbi:hypothetical protein FOL47_001055 [Perkinsus chesapeaki]|uniref:NIPA-like protein 3 n=1 Tax=Perkinsus chesapeaki TaxID=330153 RepID=A0A7J6MK46_PERCH|nr:hypothetical protein FOL47_001055 [Perkinsus chesapeaki]